MESLSEVLVGRKRVKDHLRGISTLSSHKLGICRARRLFVKSHLNLTIFSPVLGMSMASSQWPYYYCFKIVLVASYQRLQCQRLQ